MSLVDITLRLERTQYNKLPKKKPVSLLQCRAESSEVELIAHASANDSSASEK